LGHELVPEHTILSDKEREELINRYNIKQEQLPKILNTDPVILSIGAKPGQVVKIIRKSQTAKYATAYRIVIQSENSDRSIISDTK
jgi:DNA-directed RNA polymerase subunit H